MRAIKYGWVRQTFALAKSNDSGRNKLPIRRSKEERKAMVESFIKKYQKLNNGNFPSLTLTYKEVGGSYYTVREIFKKVIQENRLLGPAKLKPKEQSPDQFFGQYPLRSVSIEPETDLLLSNDSHILPSHHQDTSEELGLNSSVQCPEPGHERFDEGKIINGSSQAVDKAVYTESQARESLKLEENVEELEASKAKVTHVAVDVMVETFPLTSGSRITYSLDEKSSEHSEVTGTLVVEHIEKLEMEAGNNNSVVDKRNFLESSSDLGNKKTEAILAGSLLGKNCGLVDEKPVGNLEAPSLEASPAAFKATYALDSIRAQNLNGTNTSSSGEKSNSAKAIDGKNNSDIQNGGSSLKGSNPTLDSMNLESWETTSEKCAKPETNPLLAFYKSSVAAFVKFWSK